MYIMAGGELHSRPNSVGADLSRILGAIMDTNARTEGVNELLSRISRTIGDDWFDDACVLPAVLEPSGKDRS